MAILIVIGIDAQNMFNHHMMRRTIKITSISYTYKIYLHILFNKHITKMFNNTKQLLLYKKFRRKC